MNAGNRMMIPVSVVYGLFLFLTSCEWKAPSVERQKLSRDENRDEIQPEKQQSIKDIVMSGEIDPKEFSFVHVDEKGSDHLSQAEEFLEQKQMELALLEIGKALFDNPNDYRALVMLSSVAQKEGNQQLSYKALSLASRVDPLQPEPMLRLARMCINNGQLEEAEEYSREVIKTGSHLSRAYNLLGRIWLQRSHWDKAILYFQKALGHKPDSLFIQNNLGLAFIHRKDFKNAVQILEPLILNRFDVPAYMHNNLGLAYEGVGRLKEAAMEFTNALKKNSRYTNAVINLQRLERIALHQQDDNPQLVSSEESMGPDETEIDFDIHLD